MDFKEDIRWTQDYVLPAERLYSIWTPRASSKKSLEFYLVEDDSSRYIGPFSRQRILRAYIVGNGTFNSGDSLYRSYVPALLSQFNDRQTMKGQLQDYRRVAPGEVSPALTVYSWRAAAAENPTFLTERDGTAKKVSLPEPELREILNLYNLAWPLKDIRVTALSEGRNFHVKGAAVLFASMKIGEPYGVLDRIEYYPEIVD